MACFRLLHDDDDDDDASTCAVLVTVRVRAVSLIHG